MQADTLYVKMKGTVLKQPTPGRSEVTRIQGSNVKALQNVRSMAGIGSFRMS
ncbi:predicted protein [Sclerotinia sclerotiorum 1980 UF-70]|uniref:Uncharacterized protein n=1 Tax=Sclerotinia sclerotiorum (strain ATCC 18683 / 1980 / Ss-1) TaxID=665079 RepID=A7F2K9_SCLS1|nr:predicted protein [Sclerotinia sclerotiorum 1980 UF-70]EDN95951.1 predicted protein [Sclerotinia sclerotiorum 1980 UF-70]